MTSTTTATASPTRSGSTSAIRPAATRDGKLYKPLFAFMVIGLNGRIPLNTAGNLAGTGTTHAQHLGNSVSEIDPTYGLQNAYRPTARDIDSVRPRSVQLRYAPDRHRQLYRRAERHLRSTYNTQVDNAINASTAATYGAISRSTSA